MNYRKNASSPEPEWKVLGPFLVDTRRKRLWRADYITLAEQDGDNVRFFVKDSCDAFGQRSSGVARFHARDISFEEFLQLLLEALAFTE